MTTDSSPMAMAHSCYKITYSPSAANEIISPQLPVCKSLYARQAIIRAFAGFKSMHLPKQGSCVDVEVIAQATSDLRNNVFIINLLDSGTALRFVTSLAASIQGKTTLLTGSTRLCQRSIAPLVDSLRALGADICCLENEGFAPLLINGKRLKGGLTLDIDASLSSQFASSLLMLAPRLKDGLTLKLNGNASMPYVDMTCSMLKYHGIDVNKTGDLIVVKEGRYADMTPLVEPDCSALSYFLELSSLTGRKIEITDSISAMQPDSIAAQLFAQVQSCERFKRDMSATPDLVPALVVALALAGKPFRITGIKHLRIKESDRIKALSEGLNSLGFKMIEKEGEICWQGEHIRAKEVPHIDTFGDHRIAMAFAIAAVSQPLTIMNPQVVEKSFPGFWDELAKFGFNIQEI